MIVWETRIQYVVKTTGATFYVEASSKEYAALDIRRRFLEGSDIRILSVTRAPRGGR